MGITTPDRETAMSNTTPPIHPRTGLTAVGFRRNGEPIWPIRGGSEDAPPADVAPPVPDSKSADIPDPATGDKDWQAEAEKWKTFSRKHEEQAKANAEKAKRLDELEESQKTELQKVADRAAAAEARADETEVRAIRAEVAAAKGIPAALLSGTTQEELEASADALIEFRGQAPKPDFGGGDRGDDIRSSKQVSTLADLNQMTPEEVNKARREGRLDNLLRK